MTAQERTTNTERADAPAVPQFATAEALKLWLSERFARESNPERILRDAAAAVGRFLGASRVGYGEFEAEMTRVRIPVDWHRPDMTSVAGVHPFDPEASIARDCRRGKPVVIADIHAEPTLRDRSGPLSAGTGRAFIVVPLIDDGHPVAVFVASDDEPRVWTQDEIIMVSQTGARIWGALRHLRLTEQLRENEEQFRMMAENLPGICWVGDRDAKPLWGNRRWHAMYDGTGAARGDGRDVIHPDDLVRAKAIWQEMRAEGSPGEFQLRLRGRDGIYRPFLSKASPIRDATGAVARWVGVQIDLSDQQAQDRRQAILRSFADRARELKDPDAILLLLAGLLSEQLGVEQFIYAERDEREADDLRLFRAIDGVRITTPEPLLSGAFGAFAELDRPAETFVVRDHDIDLPADSPIRIAAAAMGMRSGINVPLVRNGRQVAGFSCLNRTPRDWNADDLALCEELAERTWAIVARARAEAALQERERAQAFLIDWTDRLRGVGDPDRIIELTLAALGRFFDVPRATYSVSSDGGHMFTIRGEWLNGAASIAHTRFSLDWAAEDQRRAWLAGEPLRFDNIADDPRVAETMRKVYAGGGIHAFLTIPLIEDGQAKSALSLQSDRPRRWRDGEEQLLREVAERTWVALERARAERELQERERAQTLLIGWTDRVRGGDVETIVATTLEMIAARLGTARATYSVSDATGRLFSITGEWREPRVPSIAGTSFSLDDVGAAVEREWRSGEIVRYDDIAVDARIEDAVRGAYLDSGIRAFVSVPLIEDGVVRSALSVQHDAPRHWRTSELELLRDLADRTWVAIERARAEAELQERERNQAFLIAWTDRVRGLTTTDAITDATLEALGQFLGVTRATYALGDTDGITFRICSEWRDHGPSIAGETFTFEQTGPVLTDDWHSGEIIRSDDVERDAAIAPAMLAPYRETGIRAFVSVPMLESGRVRSSLSVQQDRPRAWTDGELRLLREIAERIWVALERARAETLLQERERSQAFLIDWTDRIREEASPERIVATTLQLLGEYFDVSRTTFSHGDATGRALLNAGEWRNGVGSIADIVFRMDQVGDEVAREWLSGGVIRYDDVQTDPRIPAERHPFFARSEVRSLLTIPLIEGGRVRSALSLQDKAPRVWTPAQEVLLRDVAERIWVVLERARAESELQARERHQAFVIDWSDRIRSEASPDAIIATTLEWLGRHLGVGRTTYAESDGAIFTVVDEWCDGARSVRGTSFQLQAVGATVDNAWREGRVVRIDDVAGDDTLEAAARERYAGRDIGAFVSVPLVQDGRMQSALSVQHQSARVWTEAEVELIRDIAERTWVALERARAQAKIAERERHQAFLVAWHDVVRNQANPRVILGETVRLLGEHLRVSRANYAEPVGEDDALCVLEEYVDGVESVVGARFTMEALGPAIAADHLAGELLRVDDTARDARFDETNRPMFEAIGVRAVLTVPMQRHGAVLAVLSVQQDRARQWTDGELELVRDLADRTLGVLERAQSEARLAESEAQLAAFLQNAPVAMNLRDAEGRYIRVNPEFARAVGKSVEELTGLTPREIFPAHIAQQIEAVHARAANGEVASAEMSEGFAERYQSVLTIAFPIGDGRGAAKTAGFTLDLTERKRAEAALQRSRETLYQTEKLTALGSLLAGVSHELNNPLSIVVAQAVMMERQSQGSELAERAQKIRKAADRCARIVQTFLAMARQKRPEREPVDLNAIASAAHDLADFGLKNDGITTLRALTPNLPPILADSDQLHQIVINLIVNAQQAMVDAGVANRTLTLRSAMGEKPGTVVLEVADNGPGIPIEVQRRIFEPFFTTKPQGEGTGVGLSFSQGLAEAHGGTLELAPAERGACFRLTLPVDPEGGYSAPIGTPVAAVPTPPRRALVVDDEREIAESLADFLSLEGFACEIAVGGRAALATLADGQFDLIVSDLRMPDVDGPALHDFIVVNRADLKDRIGFATGDTLGQRAAKFLAELDRPVLEKPFTPEAVRRFLEQMDLA